MKSNQEIEQLLEDLPGKVAESLGVWKTAEAMRDRLEGMTHKRFKAEGVGAGKPPTSEDLRAMVKSDDACHQMRLDAIVAETKYTKVYEELLAFKTIAKIRTAY